MQDKLVGFIGQGWIGKNYADDFEERGFSVVRYSLEEPYRQNKEKIKECDFVFIAVPTPTTPQGFDFSIVQEALKLVGRGRIAIIKSTLLPGTTEILQQENPDIFVFHSPEFLTEATAAYDARHPQKNIIGLPKDNEDYRQRAQDILAILPRAPYQDICAAKEAELIKYANNIFLYFKVIFANLFFDLTKELDGEWDKIKEALAADPRIGKSHLEPQHKSGRGAGGHCFIKDFAALRDFYQRQRPNDFLGQKVFQALEEKNKELLRNSFKDLDILKEVYGEE